MIEFFIQLASENMKIRSFHLAIGINMGLESTPIKRFFFLNFYFIFLFNFFFFFTIISRLSQSWSLVSEEIKKTCEENNNFFSPIGNFSKYRQEVDEQPNIPIAGENLYLSFIQKYIKKSNILPLTTKNFEIKS